MKCYCARSVHSIVLFYDVTWSISFGMQKLNAKMAITEDRDCFCLERGSSIHSHLRDKAEAFLSLGRYSSPWRWTAVQANPSIPYCFWRGRWVLLWKFLVTIIHCFQELFFFTQGMRWVAECSVVKQLLIYLNIVVLRYLLKILKTLNQLQRLKILGWIPIQTLHVHFFHHHQSECWPPSNLSSSSIAVVGHHFRKCGRARARQWRGSIITISWAHEAHRST